MDAFDLDFEDFEEPLLPDEEEAEAGIADASRARKAEGGEAGGKTVEKSLEGNTVSQKQAGIAAHKHPNHIEIAGKSASAPCEQDKAEEFDCSNLNFNCETQQNHQNYKKSPNGISGELTNFETENLRSAIRGCHELEDSRSKTI